MNKILTCLLLIFGSATLTAQTFDTYFHDEKAAPREHQVDFQHLKLEVEFDCEAGKVFGKVEHSFSVIRESVDSIFLDAPGISFLEVKLDGSEVKHKVSGGGLMVYPNPQLGYGSEHKLTLNYQATPKKGIYFIGWNDPTNRMRKQVWTQGQGIDNRHWIPCYDTQNDKVTTDITIKFDSKYKVLSNGKLRVQKDNGDGTSSWHYQMEKPHATYLIMLGIGEYKIQEQTSRGGVKIRNWYYPDHEDRAEPSFRMTAQMMDFLEENTGTKYPWGDTYSQIPVANFLYGAMENTTATIFGDFFMVDERDYPENNYVGVNMHEMAHQWFGDYATARSDASHWLHESFATYWAKEFKRPAFDEDEYQLARRAEARSAFNASKKDNYAVGHSKGGSARVYPKGSFVIGMLKYMLGEASFKRILQEYLQRFAFRNADTHEFMNVVHDVTGQSLNWFFDQWILRGGEPHYEVGWQSATLTNGEMVTQFTVNQTHPQTETVGLFKMPIWFEVHYKDGSLDQQQVWIENQSTVVEIPNPAKKEVDYILFDPNSQILKTYEVYNSLEQWAAQAEKATHMIDRLDAIIAMAKYPPEACNPLLIDLYPKLKFHACKAAALKMLMNDRSHEASEIVRMATMDRDRNVRLAIIQNIENIPLYMYKTLRGYTEDESRKVVEAALRKFAVENPTYMKNYLKQTSREKGSIGRKVRITWLELTCMDKKGRYLKELIDYSSPAFEFRTRINAINALKALNQFDDKVMDHLSEAILQGNGRLARPAASALRYFLDQQIYAREYREYLEQSEWTDAEKAKLKRYF